MKLGMVGLGRMGGNMVKRLEQDGHEVKTLRALGRRHRRLAGGARRSARGAARGLADDPRRAIRPRTAFQELLGLLEPGDVIVDGGNSNFRDSKRRHGGRARARHAASSTPASRAGSGASRSATA